MSWLLGLVMPLCDAVAYKGTHALAGHRRPCWSGYYLCPLLWPHCVIRHGSLVQRNGCGDPGVGMCKAQSSTEWVAGQGEGVLWFSLSLFLFSLNLLSHYLGLFQHLFQLLIVSEKMWLCLIPATNRRWSGAVFRHNLSFLHRFY